MSAGPSGSTGPYFSVPCFPSIPCTADIPLAADTSVSGAPAREPCATIPVQMAGQHISDEDLERYYLGMVTNEAELAPLEEHLLACSSCVERAEDAQDRVDAIRAAIIERGDDLE